MSGYGRTPRASQGCRVSGQGPKRLQHPPTGTTSQNGPGVGQERGHKPPQRYPHNKIGNCLRSSGDFIESKSQSSSETQTGFINLTPRAFQKCLSIVVDKARACGRRGCGPVVVVAFVPCQQPGEGVLALLLLPPPQRVDLAPRFLGNKPSPPLKPLFYFFAILNVRQGSQVSWPLLHS